MENASHTCVGVVPTQTAGRTTAKGLTGVDFSFVTQKLTKDRYYIFFFS